MKDDEEANFEDVPSSTPSDPHLLSSGTVKRSLLLAHASAVVAIGGVQAIFPALPVMQEALSLSDAQVGLVNSVYLFPAMIFALPAGLLADRIGRRSVFTARSQPVIATLGSLDAC